MGLCIGISPRSGSLHSLFSHGTFYRGEKRNRSRLYVRNRSGHPTWWASHALADIYRLRRHDGDYYVSFRL